MTANDTAVCVIGSGPAGALLAASLAENGHDVVILEAGGRFDRSEDLHRMEQSLRSTPRADIWEMGGKRDAYSLSDGTHYALNERRVKGIGGTTLHWDGTVLRMHPEDFEMASRHGVNEDWPISYADLEPFYLEAEIEMGAAGAPNPFGGFRSGEFPLDPHPFSYSDRLFEQACDALDITLHHLPRAINSGAYDGRSECQGYGTCSPVCPSGAKYSADVHVRKAMDHGAQVITEAPVTKLVHTEAGDRIDRVIFHKNGHERELRAANVVIAAGAIETPRLLLLSSSETYPDGLANSSGLVGKRFMEHLAIRVRGRLEESTRQHLIGFGTSQTQQFYEYDAGPKGSILITPLNTASSRPGGGKLSTNPKLGGLLAGNSPGQTLWGDELLETVREQSNGYLSIAGGTEMLPDPANRVSLNRDETDAYGNPVPDLRLVVDDHAIATLERTEPLLESIIEETGAKDIRTTHAPENAFYANHQLGTTCMGDDPETSVVTPALRTHDLENCYISGGSVFVTGGPVSPTLTIAALSLRLAAHLDEKLAN